MSQQQAELTPEDKKLINILEIKVYDISENVQILSRQLPTNQIKEIVAHSFSIFNQLKYFFEKSKVTYLYSLMRKMQVNTVHITSILTDRLEKAANPPITTKILSNEEMGKGSSEEVVFESELELRQNVLCKKIRQLGGIYLYNEQYTRGLEYQDLKEMFPSGENEHKGKMFKRHREQFLNTIMKEIDNKAEVQVEGINDQVKDYIMNYKKNSKVVNLISCEKELGEIIDFFKLSELEALNFLNKSPKHNEYTEDYINRLNEMERDIKVKEKSEKVGILDKMKLFIEKLKERMAEIQKNYEEKNTKLVQYEKSLKRETTTEGTQTYDNFERRIKELEGKLKEQQQKYVILNSMRMAEHSLEDQVHHLNNQIQIKNNQLKKIQQANAQLQEEIEYFKKIIRQNKQKLALPAQPQKRRIRNRIAKDSTAKKIEDAVPADQNQQKVQEESLRQRWQSRSSELKDYRKARRIEKVATYVNRSSLQTNAIDTDLKRNEEMRAKTEAQSVALQNMQKVAENKINTIDMARNVQKMQSNFSTPQLSPDPSAREIKQSIFKQEHKKHTILKKAPEDQSKVSFNMPPNSQILTPQLQQRFRQPSHFVDAVIRQKSVEQSVQKSKISIEGDNFEDEEERTRRSQRKNTLRQKLNKSISSIRSIREMDGLQSRKESKSVSKKCIILKEKKDKSIITATIKLANMVIAHQFDILVSQQSPAAKNEILIYQKVRLERPSFHASLSKATAIIPQDSLKTNLVKSKTKIGVQLKKKAKAGKQKPGLQPIKSNKSFGPILLPNKRPTVEQKAIGITPEIVMDKRDSINSFQVLPLLEKGELTTEDRAYISSLLKKMQCQKGQQVQELQRIHSNSHNSKQFKAVSKKASGFIDGRNQRSQRISKGVEKWLNENSLEMEGNSIFSYLRQEIESQKFNLDELKEIMMALDSSSPPDLNCSNLKKRFTYNQAQKTKEEQLFKQHEQVIYLNKRGTKANTKNMQMFVLDGIPIAKLKEIHEKYGQCAAMNKENNICRHLQKYLAIVRRLSQWQNKQKLPYKLPIQKIGEAGNSAEREQRYRATEEVRSYRATEELGQTYLKSHQATDHNCEDEKPRILPIISSTTSGYYKPKSKLVR